MNLRREFRLAGWPGVDSVEALRAAGGKADESAEDGSAVSVPEGDGEILLELSDVIFGMRSNRPNSSVAPSSILRTLPNPPSTTDSNTSSLESPFAKDVGGASGWSFGSMTCT